jgi:uncharacterized membrane protein YqiK
MTVGDVVALVVLAVLLLVLLGWIFLDFLRSDAMVDALTRRHRLRRQTDLNRHRFEVARDGAQVRAELRDELRGRRT